ncbi:MAG: RNA polymerase sigma factor, partial [Thermoanaerobaculia bacterium]
MLPSQGFQSLLEKARGGDRGAMDRLLRVIRPRMLALARRYADPQRSGESASDLMQEAWLKTWQRLDQFHGGKSDAETLQMFEGWVGRIVHRLGLNSLRDRSTGKRKPRGREVLPLGGVGPAGGCLDAASSGPTPSARLRLSEEARVVRTALRKLPDRADREIVRLRFFEGLSLREISRRLGLGYDLVRSRYQRSLE